MKLTRRKFLGTASAAAAVLIQFKGTGVGQSVLASGDALAKLDWNSFLPFVNTKFVFKGHGGDDDVSLELVDMKDSRPLVSPARKRGGENFVLKFSGPSRLPLTEGTYIVEHFNLGTFNLFITEGEAKSRSRLYFAVINRVTS